eukprot:1350098-Pleurochrysis_carterae.AAC.1
MDGWNRLGFTRSYSRLHDWMEQARFQEELFMITVKRSKGGAEVKDAAGKEPRERSEARLRA